MPAKRSLRMDSAQYNTPSKVPVRLFHSPLTGTASLRAGHVKDTTQIQNVPQTDLEKLDSLRSKLEESMEEFIKARKELEEVVVTEGSSKLRSFFTRGSADLRTELKRHRELTSRVSESSLKGDDAHQKPFQGGRRMGSSYEFLKSIIG